MAMNRFVAASRKRGPAGLTSAVEVVRRAAGTG